jgi:hypothetical protein
MAIHDVHVDPIRSSLLSFMNLIAQAGEIGGQDGSRD